MKKSIQPFKPIERPIRVSVGGVTPFKPLRRSNQTAMKPSRWMRRAARLLHGRWIRGALQRKIKTQTRFCMLGALNRVRNGNAYACIGGFEIPEELITVVGGNVISFNDSFLSTEKDCIAALRIAADLAECNGR